MTWIVSHTNVWTGLWLLSFPTSYWLLWIPSPAQALFPGCHQGILLCDIPNPPLWTIYCLLQPHSCWSCSDAAVSLAGLCLQPWQWSLCLAFQQHTGDNWMKHHLLILPNKFWRVSNKSTTNMLRAIFSAFSHCENKSRSCSGGKEIQPEIAIK